MKSAPKKLLGLGFTLVLSANAFAATKAGSNANEESGASYGMAGCGLGSLITEPEHRNEQGWQILASLVNNFFGGIQTYAISSGTSNCVESRTTVAAMEQEVFITANLASLSTEAAQGGGDHLTGLAEVMGCSQDVGAPELARLSQDRYDRLFQNQNAKAVLDGYLHEIQAHDVLAKDCVRAS